MARTVNAMRTRRGLAPLAEKIVRPYVSQGARGMILSAFEIAADSPEYPAMREEFLSLYGGNLCVDTRLFAGMEGLLARLEAAGIAWGVVTNKFERFARPIIAELGLASRAAVVVGGDTCARAKPHPDSLLHAAAAMRVAPSRTLYVGDDERDVQAARAAGMPVVVAAYGYLGAGSPPSQWKADALCNSPAEIEAWIRSTNAKRAGAIQ
jgi:phosphoglycolate phosphatase